MKPYELDYVIENIFKDPRVYDIDLMDILTILVVVETILSKEE